MSWLNRLLLVAALAEGSTLGYCQEPPAATRGQLLYTTHCISCHTTQMHWRDDRLAHDWDSLKVQVRRWQGNASLQWVEADVDEVARHLNDTIYHFPQSTEQVSLKSRSAAPRATSSGPTSASR